MEDNENFTIFSGWRVKKQSFSLQEYLKRCDRRILRSNSLRSTERKVFYS